MKTAYCEAYDIYEGKRCGLLGEFSNKKHRCCWLHHQIAEHPERGGQIVWINEVCAPEVNPAFEPANDGPHGGGWLEGLPF